MSETGQFEKNDQPYREKLLYEAMLGYKKPKKVNKEREPLL